MRWKWSLAVPVLMLIVVATNGTAQEPVTVTFPAGRIPVDSVTFDNVIPGGMFRPDDEGREIQHTVGVLSPQNGRYHISTTYFIANSSHEVGVSIAAEATCTDQDGQPFSEGKVDRIACSVVKHGQAGQRLVCTAVYDKMDEVPEDYCVGTMACKKCGEMKVCGSSPQC